MPQSYIIEPAEIVSEREGLTNLPHKIGMVAVMDRLMVVGDRPLDDLHKVAREMRIPPHAFVDNLTLPYYRLTRTGIARASTRFGKLSQSEEAMLAAIKLCMRL